MQLVVGLGRQINDTAQMSIDDRSAFVGTYRPANIISVTCSVEYNGSIIGQDFDCNSPFGADIPAVSAYRTVWCLLIDAHQGTWAGIGLANDKK